MVLRVDSIERHLVAMLDHTANGAERRRYHKPALRQTEYDPTTPQLDSAKFPALSAFGLPFSTY